VVDAAAFLADYASADSLRERGETAGEEDERLLVDLLVEQVEFADVIVVNKADLVSEAERERLKALLLTFNPGAVIIEAEHGRVPLREVLGTGRFDFGKAQQAAGWSQALSGHHLPETEEYGISSFVWRARRPLHPARFLAFLESDMPGVVRSKGFFWLATRPGFAGGWQLAGTIGRHEAAGRWFAAVDPSRWPQDPEWRAHVKKNWIEPWGDRRQEIIFIGMEMKEAAIRAEAEACLLTEEEMAGGEGAWAALPDPFPHWS